MDDSAGLKRMQTQKIGRSHFPEERFGFIAEKGAEDRDLMWEILETLWDNSAFCPSASRKSKN